jgi:hypothetical protein
MSVSRHLQNVIVKEFAARCLAVGLTYEQGQRWEDAVEADAQVKAEEDAKRRAENAALRDKYYTFQNKNPNWRGSDADLARELGVDVSNLHAVRQARGVIRWARISALLTHATATAAE